MNKYIEAEELKKVFRDTEDAEYARWTLAGILREIDDIEAADVVKRVSRSRRPSDDLVKVVRCRECKYYIEREDGYICANDYLYKDGDWFCADGEKE